MLGYIAPKYALTRQMVLAKGRFKMADTPPDGDIPAEFVSLKYPLPNLAKALRGKAPVRIVAMGSSSTAGRGTWCHIRTGSRCI
jgi:hypothetical protein